MSKMNRCHWPDVRSRALAPTAMDERLATWIGSEVQRPRPCGPRAAWKIPEFDLVTLLPRWRDPASRKCSLRRISSGQALLAVPVHPMEKTPSACDVLTAPVNAAGTLGPRAASRTGTMR